TGDERRVALEHDFQPSLAQPLQDHRLGRVSEAHPQLRQRSAKQTVVADDAATDRNAPGPPSTLQLPGVESSRCVRTKRDALMAQQVLGSLGRSAARKVRRRT